MDATTLSRVKAYMVTTASTHDALLTELIGAVSKDIEHYLGYELEQAARTEVYDTALHDRIIFLKVIPVVSIASVKIGPTDWDFSALTALTVDDEYRLGDDGQLYLNLIVQDGFQKAEVIYTAGLATTAELLAVAAPDLALAANMQVAQEFRRRNEPVTVSIPTPKGAKTMIGPHVLLPRVRQLLDRRARLVLRC